MLNLEVQNNKKVYFASDSHFGAPSEKISRERERLFLDWLEEVRQDAAGIFLLGDLFDFWFEYKHVVPKGFVRVLGKLAEIRDSGIPIYFFVGNHDLWMKDYFEKELGIPVFHHPKNLRIGTKEFLIGHGDGLGPGDKGYKRMKKLFTFPLAQWMYRWLHPDIGVPVAQYFSLKNKMISGDQEDRFLGEENEWLIQYCRKKLESRHFDYFIFGHRHLPIEFSLGSGSTYLNLGDWINYYSYAEFDGMNLKLRYYEKEKLE